MATAGGVDKDGVWISMQRAARTFIPHEVVSDMFEKCFSRLLKEAMARPGFSGYRPLGALGRFGDFQMALEEGVRRLDHWRVCEPARILRYLAQFAVSGPVPNSKMVAVSKQSVTYLMQPMPDIVGPGS